MTLPYADAAVLKITLIEPRSSQKPEPIRHSQMDAQRYPAVTFFCYNKLRALVPPEGSMANKPAFAQGAQVEHPKFGLGSVMSCNEDYIVIKFDDHGEKKFVLQIVLPNLKKSDRTPPVEKRRSSKKKAVPVA
jgi:hypothetical protein